MAFTNQFSLSVELSKLVPLAPIVNLASRSMLDVVRALHKSGSDLATEHDLAEVLGRSYIEPRFVRNFKNAVRESTIRKLSGVAELVLEAGAGPTVQNAVGDAAMFSMVVQLSLLLWAHHTKSLATALTKAFELRKSRESGNSPLFEDVMGTLRCISQQTSGFMWELVFAAVDAKIKGEIPQTGTASTRILPYVVLRTLLDALPAVQRFPESHTLSIRTRMGITTLVVWAHHVLGLTVEVRSDGRVLKFGEGPPEVQIDQGSLYEIVNDEVVLLNETEDVIFQSRVDALDDPQLEAADHHTLEGYGSTTLESRFEAKGSVQGLVTRIMQSCLLILKEGTEGQAQSNLDIRGDSFIAPIQRVITIGRIMFPAYDISLEVVEALADRYCLARADWYTDEISTIILDLYRVSETYDIIVKSLRPWVRKICHIILALSAVRNIQDCREVPLSTGSLPKENYQVVGILNAEQAFETLAYLFLGYSKYSEETDYRGDIKRAVVVSNRGWSLCISSIGAPDPGMFHSEVAIVRGVPTREGHRKEWIQDHTSGTTWDSTIKTGDNGYKVVASEGALVSCESFWPISESKYSIGTTAQSFLVFKTLTCYDHKRETSAYLRVGFRYMQSLYWRFSHIQPCEHVSHVRDTIVVPHRTWVFRGLLSTLAEAYLPGGPWALGAAAGGQPSRSDDNMNVSDIQSLPEIETATEADVQIRNSLEAATESQPSHRSENIKTTVTPHSGGRGVHLSLSAGNSAVRWILLANAQRWVNELQPPNFAACYLRNHECCVECAIRFIKERRSGMTDEHVALIT